MEGAGRGTVSAEHVRVLADALAEHDGTLDLRDVELLVRCARRVASSEADPEALLRIWDHVDSRLRYLLMPAIVEHEKISSTWLADAIVALDQGGFSWTQIPNGPRGTEVVEEVIRQGVSSDLSLRLLEKIRERPEGARVSALHESFGELVRQRLVELQEPGRALSIDLAEHEFAVVSLLDKLDRSTPQAADEVNSWQGSEWPRARAAAVAAARRMGLDVNTDALIASARTPETRRMILSVFGGDDRIREWTTPEAIAEALIADYACREDWTMRCPSVCVIERRKDLDGSTLLALQADNLLHLVRVPAGDPLAATHVALGSERLPDDWPRAISSSSVS